MRKAFALVLAAGMGVIVGIAGMTAATPKLSGQDYGEIQALYAKYAHGFDSSNPEMYASVFTPDGEFVIGQRVLKGRKEIGELAASRGPVKNRAKIFHVNSNLLIEPSLDGAKGSAYVVLMDLAKNPAITGGGVYEDTIVRTSQGWLFRKRAYFAEPAPPGAAQTSAR